MKKCGEKTEVYSRVCGYFRPVSNWNKGKKEEFKDRKLFLLSKKTAFLSNAMVVCAIFLLFLTSGCATEKIAEGITTKNVSGNGTVIESHIGINTDSKIPELKTLFISGDIATVKAGTNAVSYREESSASIWNASSVTKKRFLAITLTDAGDVPSAIKAVAEVFRTAEAEETYKKTENASIAVSVEAKP